MRNADDITATFHFSTTNGKPMKSRFPWLVTAALVSCMQAAQATQTVDWYKDHDAARFDTAKRCAEKPEQLQDSPDCVNAQTAANALMWKSRKGVEGLKPLTFGTKPRSQ